MQHNSGGSYSTILAANTILNTGKFVKMIHREDGGSSHHSGLENMIAGLAIRMANHPLYPTLSPTLCIIITSIAFCQPLSISMHCTQNISLN